MDKSSQLLYGESFGEYHYRFGKTLDGIDRSNRTPGALTTESTYRLVLGYPDVYMTCIYRWSDLPVIKYISQKATEIGKRLGKNILIVPIEGNEELFWKDAKVLLKEIAANLNESIELNDQRVYVLISGCNPRLLLDADSPFLICDITELSSAEFVGFFSKILDLFDVEVEANFIPGMRALKKNSVGKCLLLSQTVDKSYVEEIQRVLFVLAEITFVLEQLAIQYCGFRWPIEDNLGQVIEQIHQNPERLAKLNKVKSNLAKFKTSYDTSPNNKMPTTVIRGDIVMKEEVHNYNISGQAGAVGPNSSAQYMTFSQENREYKIDAVDMNILVEELSMLHTTLKERATMPEHDIAISNVASAEAEARKGDKSKALNFLSQSGKWVLDIAKEIGANIAVAAIKQSLGLK